MKQSISIAIVSLSSAVLSQCKDSQDTSNLRTLDNVASSNPVFEACSGDGPLHHKAGLDEFPHLQEAIRAVPMSIQKGFFEDLGGKIRVVDSSGFRDCLPLTQRADDGLSCWRRLPERDASIEVILRKTTNAKEQYALVRALGFVYGDILLNRSIPRDLSAPVSLSERPMGSLKDFKAHLASVFIGDLYAITPATKRQETIGILADLGIAQQVVIERDFAKRWALFSRLPQDVQDSFASRVFAESFQSQFCTRASAERACRLFGNTMKSFAPYAQDITDSYSPRKYACELQEHPGELAAANTKSSSARLEWFNQFESKMNDRRIKQADTGGLVNAKIAELAVKQQARFSLTTETKALSLNGDFFSLLQSLLSGGLSSGGGGGFGGMLGQLLVGGSSMGGLSSILSSLGLGASGGGNLGGDSSGNGGISSIPSNPGGSNSLPPSSGGGVASTEEQAAIDATNKYRQSQGKKPLQVDNQMITDCRKQAQMQADRGGLQHWLYPAGVATGENIAYGSQSGEYTVMEQWVKSPGHHANIMGNYSYIGLGNVGNQWCQRFR